MKKVLIAGTGFSGAVVARQLALKGYDVTIYEKRSTIAGNMYDELQDNIVVQIYGPHIFHTSSKKVMDFLEPYVEWFDYKHTVKGYIDGKLVPIPFNLTSLETLFDEEKATYIKKILIKEIGLNKKVPIMQLKRHQDKVIREFGDYVFEKVFYHYTCKQWGMEPKDLAPGVIERVPVSVSYEDCYFTNDTYHVMPKGGFTPIFEKMLNHPNIKVNLNTNILDVLTFKEDGTYYKGEKFDGDIIYTGCIDELFNYQFGKLPYRTLDFKFETHNIPSFQEVSVVNYPNTEDYTRISEFSKFTCEEQEKTIIVKEYPRDHTLNDIPYYPIEIEPNINEYKKYLELANKYPNLHLLGRLANYQYINMDKAILNALELVEKL